MREDRASDGVGDGRTVDIALETGHGRPAETSTAGDEELVWTVEASAKAH